LILSPLLRAGFCNDRLKNPVATAPGSDRLTARRQLFDDSILAAQEVMGIFPKRRGFLDTARFS
jgi:hypothetical protein